MDQEGLIGSYKRTSLCNFALYTSTGKQSQVPPEAANFSLKNDYFERVVLYCFAFLLCCCCCCVALPFSASLEVIVHVYIHHIHHAIHNI